MEAIRFIYPMTIATSLAWVQLCQ